MSSCRPDMHLFHRFRFLEVGWLAVRLVGWLVRFWCIHFRDLPPLINLVVQCAKVKAFYGTDNNVNQL